MNILIIHGPNLNLLGTRQPQVYGSATLEDVDCTVRVWGSAHGVNLRVEQTNHEGAMIDLLHEAAGWADGIVINPGGYAHTSIAVADAIRAIGIPCVEVHLTNIFARDYARRRCVTGEACVGVIAGLGPQGYVAACAALVDLRVTAASPTPADRRVPTP